MVKRLIHRGSDVRVKPLDKLRSNATGKLIYDETHEHYGKDGKVVSDMDCHGDFTVEIGGGRFKYDEDELEIVLRARR